MEGISALGAEPGQGEAEGGALGGEEGGGAGEVEGGAVGGEEGRWR